MKKQRLSIMTLTMCLPLLSAVSATASAADITPSQPTAGDGTLAQPYQIGTAAELYWFAE